MSIENNLERIATALETIAHHLAGAEVNTAKTDGEAKKAAKKPAKKATKTKAETKPKDEPKKLEVSDVQDALVRVANTLSRDVARGILGEFNAKKVSDLKESEYGAVIELCHTTMEEAEKEGAA